MCCVDKNKAATDIHVRYVYNKQKGKGIWVQSLLSKEAGYDVFSVQHCTHYQSFVKIRHYIIQLFHFILFF